jgi:tetratricopeptide (TPR) repeat protein
MMLNSNRTVDADSNIDVDLLVLQEYTRAYNAYSAALQLSPVGPSSHVFLSNRSAALLSLKRYSAAATDARRAIALAPTFGKAHARLGQSLYFLKEYESAVAAYEDAIHYEPDNPITRTYLEKARTKWQRQKDKAVKNSGRGGDGEVSVLTAESSVQHTVVNSVATDPNASAAVVTTGFRGQSKAMMDAVGRDMTKSSAAPATTPLPPAPEGAAVSGDEGHDAHEAEDDFDYNQEDPDFDEALRIQERANRYLANKNYKYAIEEYTAALFLVPDDENLSPELHLGRAHALNGSRRHESAKIDATLAIRIKPTPEAYSTLAKSLFYMKDYEGAIEAFGKCKELLPEGESLSMFDRAYLQKAEKALHDEVQEGKIPHQRSSKSNAAIPKLKPPKFVSREEALNRTPNMPSMPKQWPQQSPRDKKIIKFGPEREVVFLSEALGIKLNRGPDGIVRVIEVSPEVPGSPIAREGNIQVGDVIREAAGVDIRRPITNIMWGDTVALIKMAPRPIVLVVAKEETGSIMDQRMQAAQSALSPTSASQYFPSSSSTEERVRDQMSKMEQNAQVSRSIWHC